MRFRDQLASVVAQQVADRLYADGGPRPPLGRILGVARRELVRHGDPVVTVEFAGRPLQVPLSHQLPVYRRQWPRYSQNLARLAAAVDRERDGCTMIDIGANVGDSVFLVRSVSDAPILAIEGDERYLELLRDNTAGLDGVEIEPVFVGSGDGLQLGVDAVGGTAHLRPAPGGAVPMASLAAIVGRHPAFRAPALLKSDTDGYEAQIIGGNLEWISRARPVLFVEYDPDFLAAAGSDGLALIAGLSAAGYSWCLIYDNLGEPLAGVSLHDAGLLGDLHSYLVGRRGDRYFDLALFHRDDADLYEGFRRSEVGEAVRVRGQAPGAT